MQEIDFTKDTFSDILARDRRYDAKAYALLLEAFSIIPGSTNISYAEILDAFKEVCLTQFGPLAYTVLTEWGLKECIDIGEMMFNLVESGRLAKNDGDNYEDFRNGYSFKEAFIDPFKA
ncbi:MAG: hypothetical protein J6S51_05735 [Kiritimatiellae bacterium]|nr:hypothetical protein [Kiritimatiellia bacterium]